jgi:hypothetical protein
VVSSRSAVEIAAVRVRTEPGGARERFRLEPIPDVQGERVTLGPVEGLRRAGGETDGVAVLCVAHDLRGQRGLATEGTAELADDPVRAGRRAFIQMHLLARERGASTVGAAMAVGLERTDATPQQDALELLDMAYGGHGLKDSLPRAGFLPGAPDGRDVPLRTTGRTCL